MNERLAHKTSIAKSRMRNLEVSLTDYAATVQNEVEIEGSWAAKPQTLSVPSPFKLEQTVEQRPRGQTRQPCRHSVEIRWLRARDAFRFSFEQWGEAQLGKVLGKPPRCPLDVPTPVAQVRPEGDDH